MGIADSRCSGLQFNGSSLLRQILQVPSTCHEIQVDGPHASIVKVASPFLYKSEVSAQGDSVSTIPICEQYVCP